MRTIILGLAALVVSCGQTPLGEAPAPQAPAAPSLGDMSPREALLDCAGAVTAAANIDPLASEPTLGTPEENLYFTVLALMDKEPDLMAEAGRRAAAQSRDAWLARSAEARAARAGECATRFGG